MMKTLGLIIGGLALCTSSSSKEKMELNTTTGGPYTYDQSAHHFWGVAYDGSYIDTTAACAGANDSCRNNPSCECTVSYINFSF
jgi:hypothetical protein